MSRPAIRVATGALALALLVAACGSPDRPTLSRPVEPTSTTSTTTVPLPTLSAVPRGTIARATVPMLQVFDTPEDAAPSRELENPWVVDPAYPDQTVPQVFLVKERRSDGWLRVLLPVRPNGSSGWVRATDVTVTSTPYYVRVELGARRITVTEGDRTVYEGPVAIGKPATPTPVGEYFVRVKIKAINPNTVYGPYAWGLSSHSEVLETFNGGDGEIGIHGNNDASVLGKEVSAGCVRMDNTWITRLTDLVPLGTPVDIVP